MKLLIMGGVAGGASAATRARRLSEGSNIVRFERGPDVSFAYCGLSFHVGGDIEGRDKFLVVTPERMRDATSSVCGSAPPSRRPTGRRRRSESETWPPCGKPTNPTTN